MRRILSVLVVLGLLALPLAWQVAGQTSVVSSQIQVRLDITDSFLVGLSTVTARFQPDYTQLLAHGTGANQATTLWQDDRTLGVSTSEDLDLNASLTDAFGNSVTCTKLKALIVKADSANTNNVLVGGVNTTITSIFSDTTDQAIVRPGGLFLFTAPDSTGAALTAGSADVLTVGNSGGSTAVDYDILVLCVE